MSQHFIPQLGQDPASAFPDPADSDHPDGLVAWGGDLSRTRLLNAYQSGIFPWYEHGSPLLWWSPEPRAVLIPGGWHLPRRLARTLRQGRFEVRLDTAFAAVVDGCAAPRPQQASTWITPAMRRAYIDLHTAGHGHSIEIFDLEGQLIGGLYGVALGRLFFAESKFHRQRDASKIALAVLMRCLESWDFLLADCQLWNPHLETLGVRLLDRVSFQHLLEYGLADQRPAGHWTDRLASVNLEHWQGSD